MSCEIRAAQKGDEEVLLSLIAELAEYENLTDKLVTDAETLGRSLFEHHQADALLAFENGIAIGYAIFFSNFSTFWGRAGLYLEDIYIQPDKRGKGYGTAIFKHLQGVAQQRGCPRMEWSCLKWNQPSINFYKSMGAESLDEWTTFRLNI